MLLTPTEAIAHVSQPLAGFPACIAGSAVAAETYGLPLGDKADVDVFCYSDLSLVAATQRLIDSGFQLEDRFARVWERWLRYGFRNWHTNSIKFHDPSGLEVNLVYKLLGKNPVNSLAQVIESFDFGLLAVGYDLLTGNKHDMRSYLFPTYDIDGPLPMMPNKRGDWVRGLISQYNGTREPGRYAKYVKYGFDLSLVKPDLIEGFYASAAYWRNRGDDDHIKLAEIYEIIAEKIEFDEIDELFEAGKVLPTLDTLDQIMEALE